MTIDFAAQAVRDDHRRAQLEDPPLGGGFQPLFGEMRQIWVASGQYAWDVVGGNPVAPRLRDDRRPVPAGRLEQITLTPQGFIKAAIANNGTRQDREPARQDQDADLVLQCRAPSMRHARRSDAWSSESKDGSAARCSATRRSKRSFTDYRDFNGVKFPTTHRADAKAAIRCWT